LEDAGFLKPLSDGERFARVCRGQWQIVLVRQPSKPRRQSSDSPWTDQLVRRGVTESVAQRLAREHAPDRIQSKIAVFDGLIARKDKRVSKNPPGYLVQSIREDYQAPRDGGANDLPRRRPPAMKQVRPSGRPVCGRADSQEEQVAKDYWNGLSPAAQRVVEADAMASAPRILAEGFARAKESGNSRLSEEYRQGILLRYLRGFVGEDAQPRKPVA
jgi:hypothetical protein